MLKQLLADKMRREQLSARDAAKQIGLSHTTVIRITQGDIPTIENIGAVCKWLGVDVSTALGVESGVDDDIAKKVALVVEAEPRLKELFTSLTEDYLDGNLTAEDVEEIVAYAAFRIHRKGKGNARQTTSDVLPKGS